MKVSKGQFQPEIVAAAFLILEAWFTIFVPGFDCDSGYFRGGFSVNHQVVLRIVTLAMEA